MESSKGIRLLALGAIAVLSAACAAGPAATGAAPTGSSPAAGAPAAGEVQVTLQEWAVGAVPQTAPAGQVNFTVTNTGPNDTHEFVVIKTDLSLIDLPTDADGAVDEGGGGMTVEGEIEDVLVGSTQSLSLTLTPGAYVFICNIYSAEENEAHYQEGMRTSFNVT